MIITGAGGFAIEVLELLHQQGVPDIVFFDEAAPPGKMMFDVFRVLRTQEEAMEHFKQVDRRFALGTGRPALRRSFAERMTDYGGELTSVISRDATIGSFGNTIEPGVSIMQGAIITNAIHIGTGSLLNLHVTVGHGAYIGPFCEISPGVNISGNCHIGDRCVLGTNAVVLPGVRICPDTIVGASALVTRPITEPGTYVGVPVKKIK